MTQKNLIHDILTYLTANPKAMEKFNNITEDYPIYNDNLSEFFNDSATLSGKKHFILFALSSPNDVPICDFLAGENPEYADLVADRKAYELAYNDQTNDEDVIEIAYERYNYLNGLLTNHPKTISATLYYTLCNCIEQGMNFSKIEKVLNLKYNELLCP